MDDMHARVPVDRVAVRVVMLPGEHFNPNKKVLTNDSEMPLRIRNVSKTMKERNDFTDFTGRRFGRFIVLGMSKDFKGWVVRCDCGRYSTRRSAAIKNEHNKQDRCEHCRHLAYLQRYDLWKSTGIDRRHGMNF